MTVLAVAVGGVDASVVGTLGTVAADPGLGAGLTSEGPVLRASVASTAGAGGSGAPACCSRAAPTCHPTARTPAEATMATLLEVMLTS